MVQMKLESVEKGINCIIKFADEINKIDPGKELKIVGKLIGPLGEMYANRELLKRSYTVEPKGGQSGCDLIVDPNVRIEIKTSLLKNENIYKKSQFFGWTVKTVNQKKGKKFDIMICTALDGALKPKFFIFTYDEAFLVGDVNFPEENHNWRYRSTIQKKIHLFENEKSYLEAFKEKPWLITPYEQFINIHPKRFLNKWEKIGFGNGH